ncbi:MAG: hypothetical protein ACOX8B_07900 [Lachnospiraceae bacterium]|jgi:cytoskeletal protein RodZ
MADSRHRKDRTEDAFDEEESFAVSDDTDEEDETEEEKGGHGHGGLVAFLIILIILAALIAEVAVYTHYTGTNPLSGVPVIGELFDRALPSDSQTETVSPTVAAVTTTAAETTTEQETTTEATTEEPTTEEPTTEEVTTEEAVTEEETTEAAAAVTEAAQAADQQIVSDGNTSPLSVLTVVTDSLNVHSDASTSSTTIGQLYRSEERYVYQTANDGTYNWYRVPEGWVADNGTFVQVSPLQ